MFHFGVLAVPLKLIDSLLEQSLLVLVVFLVLLLLLLQEIKLTGPESLVLLELSLDIRIHPLDFEVFDLPLLDLFSNAELTLG